MCLESGQYNSLYVSLSMSSDIEGTTRNQSATHEWHKLRQNRITASKLKCVCCLRSNFESLASQLLTSRNVTTAAMKYGMDNEPGAAKTYAKSFGRNVYHVGFVINPSCFFIGASPDRHVYDPDIEDNPCGLLEINA